jgi:hypothetical protein
MNINVKEIYIGCLTKNNFQTNISQSGSTFELDQFFVADQTIGWEQQIYTISDMIKFVDVNAIYDWGDDEGKVLDKLDSLK